MEPILNGECRNAREFFDRLGASERQRQSHVPLLLTIEHTYAGEMASTLGVFLNSRNKCLYEVHGSECSMWRFNGQFEPELIGLEEFERRLEEFKAPAEKKRALLAELEALGLSKEAVGALSASYASYLGACDITKESEDKISALTAEAVERVFSRNKVQVEEGLSYYEFNTNYGYPETFFVDFNLGGKPRVSSALDKAGSSFKDLFLSDLAGGLEIDESVFDPPPINALHASGKPKMK